MRINAFTITVFILLLGGIIAGYFVGDWALESAELTRPKDVVQCRVGYPFAGASIMFYPAVIVASWVENLFKN